MANGASVLARRSVFARSVRGGEGHFIRTSVFGQACRVGDFVENRAVGDGRLRLGDTARRPGSITGRKLVACCFTCVTKAPDATLDAQSRRDGDSDGERCAAIRAGSMKGLQAPCVAKHGLAVGDLLPKLRTLATGDLLPKLGMLVNGLLSVCGKTVEN